MLIDRRSFVQLGALAGAAHLTSTAAPAAPQVAITMDDFNFRQASALPPEERSARILATLRSERAKVAAFVIGRNAEFPEADSILRDWAAAGHMICNHSFSHLNYHSPQVTVEQYVADFEHGDAVLRTRRGFHPFFRFPFLREGDTAAKRDGMRAALRAKGYRNGHVTMDTADWLIDERLRKKLGASPKADARPVRDLYVKHMLAGARYHHELALAVLGREVLHTVLTHFLTLNAMFLGDVIAALKAEGWRLVDAGAAYADDVFHREPSVLPAGNSLIVALANETGKKYDVRVPDELSESWVEREMARIGW